MIFWETITQDISAQTQSSFSIVSSRPVGGGSINSAYRLVGDNQTYFVKYNVANKLTMFEAEAAGLVEIAKADVIKVPKPVCWGISGDSAYIVLEHIEFNPRPGFGSSVVELGRQLAAMHRITQSQYGWHRENTIGSTPQINHFDNSWISFWRDHRLGFQLRLAAENGFAQQLQRKGEKLQDSLAVFYENYVPDASLLHGDLWSGNYAIDAQGKPVIFDPAVYYGDREADIAMTELFGGFPVEFYRAYNENYAMDVGYNSRKTLYNLYHMLNHLNLFGSGYLSQCESMLDRLLSEV
ncbi:MAG: fructosamine kinase family protein [Gammaproteobacteria bacterium]|nr:fructosamine kinase family protein [Gammaproteobacteria bacterium]